MLNAQIVKEPKTAEISTVFDLPQIDLIWSVDVKSCFTHRKACIDINRKVMHSSNPGSSNDVPMVFLEYLFNDLDWSESPKSP